MLALVVLAFAPGLLEAHESPKSAIVVVAGLVSLTVLVVERLASRQWPVERDAAVRSLDACVLLWIGAVALATLRGVSPRLSLLGEIGQREGLLVAIALGGIYAVVRGTHRGAGHVRATLDAFLAIVALASLYAVLQFIGWDPIVGMHRFTYAWSGGVLTRPSSTLGNPNLLGTLLAAALGIAASRIATGSGPFGRSGPLAALLTLAIATTLSRGAWLAAAASIGFALAGTLSRSRGGAPGWWWKLLAAIGIPFGCFAGFMARGALPARLAESAQSGTVSTSGRLEIVHSSLALWREHPITGIGPNAFGLLFPSVQTPGFWRSGWQGTAAHAHSAPLQLLVTLGVVGAGVALLGLVSVTLLARCRLRAPGPAGLEGLSIAAGIVGVLVAATFNPLGTAGAMSLLLLCGLLASTGGASTEPAAVSLAVRRITASAGIGVAILACAAHAGQYLAWREGGRARGLYLRSAETQPITGDRVLVLAAREATRAVRHAPEEEELWRIRADIELARVRIFEATEDAPGARASVRSALEAASMACALEPRRAANVQRLANAWTAAGRTARDATELAHAIERTDSCFALAAELAPCDAFITVDEVRARLELGRGEAALASARRIVQLYPEAAIGHSLEAAALLAIDEPVPAAAALRRALRSRWEEGEEKERSAAEAYLRQLEPGRDRTLGTAHGPKGLWSDRPPFP